MSDVPLNSKISIINKYIQLNNLKAHGKSEHEDFLVNHILESIINDLKTVHETPTKPKISLQPVIQELKTLHEDRSSSKNNLEPIIEDLKKLHEIQLNPPASLESIIKNLETLDES